jgi:hypothetical protein
MTNSIESAISPARLSLYLEQSGGSKNDALVLYCWNTSLCQALYWPLHAFEIVLRNAMAEKIRDAHGSAWYDDLTLFSTSRKIPAAKEIEQVEKAKNKLDDAGKPYNHDNIVAVSTLGFWHGLLKLEYETKLWTPFFEDLLEVAEREEAWRKINQLKRLRNNVAHYEPIFVWPDKRKRQLYREYKMIVKIIRWICPETAAWVESHCSKNFFDTWNCAPNAFGAGTLTVITAGTEANSAVWQFP